MLSELCATQGSSFRDLAVGGRSPWAQKLERASVIPLLESECKHEMFWVLRGNRLEGSEL